MKKDITGIKLNKLTAISFSHVDETRNCCWVFLCECGNEIIRKQKDFSYGSVKSCGCLVKSRPTEVHGTHGRSGTLLYGIWTAMLARCKNKNNKKYHLYGGAGISVCDRWLKFENFLNDMGERPAGFTLDRRDGTQGYSKENCRWATIEQQNRNVKSQTNSSSKYKGVSWSKRAKKWLASIHPTGGYTYLGAFASEDDAARAYNKKALEIWGDDARLNAVKEEV